MSINALLSTIILVTFIVTVVLAVGSYVAYKVRERRHPDSSRIASDEPVFFERFFPGEQAAAADAAPAEQDVATR
jgi:predicted negative regulator of RcsB-dependent stress response